MRRSFALFALLLVGCARGVPHPASASEVVAHGILDLVGPGRIPSGAAQALAGDEILLLNRGPGSVTVTGVAGDGTWSPVLGRDLPLVLPAGTTLALTLPEALPDGRYMLAVQTGRGTQAVPLHVSPPLLLGEPFLPGAGGLAVDRGGIRMAVPTVLGNLDRAEIESVLAGEADSLTACAEGFAARAGELPALVSGRVKLEPDGPANFDVLAVRPPDEDLATCISSWLANCTFPPSETGGLVIFALVVDVGPRPVPAP